MVVSTEKRALAVKLRGEGLSYGKIAEQTNASKSTVYGWCKNAQPSDRTNERPSKSRSELNINTRSNRTDERVTRRSNVQIKKQTPGQKKRLPIGASIIFLVMILGTVLVALWLRTPEKEPKDSKAKPKSNDKTPNDFTFEDLELLKEKY